MATNKNIQLAPSMMCADFLSLREELDVLVQQKVEFLHIDIMDGHYVPNYTLGPDLAYAMYDYSKIPLDFHLMVEDVDSCFRLFTKYPCSVITIHPETSRHPVRTMEAIRDQGCKAGLAIDPGMSLETVKHLLPLADVVCVMTVNPGFAGQKLLPFCLDKVEELASWRKQNNLDFLIEIDGNVSWDNIPPMIKVGGDILVLGTSSVFNETLSRIKSYGKLNQLIESTLNKDGQPV